MGKPSPPAPPDPKETAQAQTATNVGTAIANANLGFVNQVTPTGTLTYDQTGSYQWTDPVPDDSGNVNTYDIPTYTATTTMSPEMQAIYDANLASQGNLANLGATQSAALGEHMSQPFQLDDVSFGSPNLQTMGQSGDIATSFDGGPQVKTDIADAGQIQTQLGNFGDITQTYGANDFSADRQRVEDALMARMNPYIEQDREGLRTQLTNQGFQEGTEGYDRAMDRFERGVSDQRLGAILNAGSEQSRLMDMEANRAGFQNAAQAQAFGQGATGMQLGNQAQGQQFGQNLHAFNAYNQAAGQAFDQNLAGAAFGNQAQGQQFQQDLAGTQFDNNIAQQNLSNDMTLQNYYDSRAMQNRNQPINEISALLSGSQVTPPQFQTSAPPQIPTVDYAGLVNDHYAQEMQRYQVKQANNPLGTILSLGSMFL